MSNSSQISLQKKHNAKSQSDAHSAITSAPRAIITEYGIALKDQFHSESNASFSSCFSCASKQSASQSTTYPNSISYHDILAAKYIHVPNVFNDEESPSSTKYGSISVTDADLDYDASTLVEITYAQKKKNQLVPVSVKLQVDPLVNGDIVEEIYKNSYKHSKPRQSILALVNPHGGKGKALKVFLSKAKPIFDAAQCKVEIKETEYNKHAIDIMQSLDVTNYDIIACASGDGIPYEVINGMFKREDRAHAFNKLSITQIPCGSGNAMSESCHWTGDASAAALSTIKAASTNIDLMAVTHRGKVTVSFLSQTIGIIADSDIDTEHLRFLGAVRFDLGVCYKVFARTKYPCEIYIKYAAKTKDELRRHYDSQVISPLLAEQSKLGNTQSTTTDTTTSELIEESNFHLKYDATAPVPDDWEKFDQDLADNIGIFYTGKMPYISKDVNFFPAALPNDGTMDLVIMDSRTPITRQAPILLSLDKGAHVNAPEIIHSKILAYRLIPKGDKNRCLSIDGERYEYDEFQTEVLPNTAKFLLREGTYVNTNF
ncbi:hypothetical protein WICPIJ_004923 [Wickerhamomyces pijperi]|uniref:sphingosine kinase n=1 Tax=Wickerhamomyces pijperi TaxID=599730 RepID=A0A9P8Q736_WICPI|nr:hypothetical protein WICPIJ_004923 [Wickerhamomyces pijperi]